MNPTFAGFLVFVQNVMGIPASVLVGGYNADVLKRAFNVAMNTVNRALAAEPNFDPTQPTMYALAVYNLAGDRVINFAQDVPASTYFADLRSKLNITGFVSGTVSSTSDNGSSMSVTTPEFAKNMTIGDLQTFKTPWGREYMAIAQDYGPTIWGLTI